MTAVGIYARVSSERQAQQATIESQLAALQQRAETDGHVVTATDIYVDDGVSGSTLLRPALEQLRDRVAQGSLDVLYVLSPDRLARKYAYQVLLLDEFSKHGVSTIFVQGPSGNSAEDELLVQVQGMIAEYERAKILERSRRGKIHRARQGSVAVLDSAPYGYVYVKKTEVEPANYRVLLHEAKIVREIFNALALDQKSLGQIARDLNQRDVPTPGGGVRWYRSTVRNIATNPAYSGKAAFGKTRQVDMPRPLRPRRGQTRTPKSPKTTRTQDKQHWIEIDVPAIVRRDIFDSAQEQLERNRRLSARNGKSQHLLQGLSVCAHCGYTYYGATTRRSKEKGGATYSYYRCMGSDPQRFAGEAVCENRPVRAEQLESHVWESVVDVLMNPRRMLEEWALRYRSEDSKSDLQARRAEASKQLSIYRNGLQRLVDAYEVGALDLAELKTRTEAVRQRIQNAQREIDEADTALQESQHLKLVVGRVQEFGSQLKKRFDVLSWDERQQIVRMLVDKVEIDDDGATVVFRVPAAEELKDMDSTAPIALPPDSSEAESYGLRTGCHHDLTPKGDTKAPPAKRAPEQRLRRSRIESHVVRALLKEHLPAETGRVKRRNRMKRRQWHQDLSARRDGELGLLGRRLCDSAKCLASPRHRQSAGAQRAPTKESSPSRRAESVCEHGSLPCVVESYPISRACFSRRRASLMKSPLVKQASMLNFRGEAKR